MEELKLNIEQLEERIAPGLVCGVDGGASKDNGDGTKEHGTNGSKGHGSKSHGSK